MLQKDFFFLILTLWSNKVVNLFILDAARQLRIDLFVDKSILSKWLYFRFRDQRVLADIWTSIDCGCSSKADIGALEMFVDNLKSNRILRKFKHFFQCFPAGTVRTMYVHCTNCTYIVRTLYVQWPLGYNVTCQLKRKLENRSQSYTRLSRSEEHNFP